MKSLFCFLFALTSLHGFSQTEKLFYYSENDSLIGVKNEKGQVIIPAKYCLMSFATIKNNPIKENVILFWIAKEGPKAYDRKGNFLFTPYIFDNGFDDFQEGCMRFTENKKIGLANKNGTVVIPAKYDWISPVTFGIVNYCNGCYWDRSKDEEHPALVGGTWGYLDKAGNEIALTRIRNHPKDIKIKNNEFIPYQFRYTAKEIGILDFFEKRKELIITINHLVYPKENFSFEITERPTESEPYYIIRSFELLEGYAVGSNYYDDFQNFKVSADGKKYYVTHIDLVDHKEYSEYVARKTEVDKWIQKELRAVKK
ncbi:WG repeat-containing protein [Flavobacterium humi]|uniref:WG repeat-containing protein n=1 Tax=Flavobacterium humi TaxID=2562683 RepID=A0A4Z0LCW5_9FLAO|nr:WG repeat-containing protein [Flavobacterium humi]TGD59721.1 hypothetical protein E4635_01945 [Flavobacterium humi]